MSARLEWDWDITQYRAFYNGHQTPTIDKTIGRLTNQDYDQPMNRLNNNVLPDFVRTMTALYEKEGVRWRTAPASSEDSDRDAARRCDQFLQWVWYRHDMDVKQMDLIHRKLTESLSHLKILWDPVRKDFDVGVIPAQRVYWEPGVPSIRDAQWAIEVSIRSTDQIREQYGVNIRGSDSLSTDVAENHSQWGFTAHGLAGENRLNSGSLGLDYSGHGSTEWILMLEYWERPSRQFPAGRYIVTVGESLGRVLFYRPYPWAHGKLPYIDFEDVPALSTPFPRCVMWDLAPIVREINRITELLDKHMERAIDPPVLAPTGALNKQSLGDPNNRLIEYDNVGGFPPQFMNVPQLTGTALQELDRLYQTFERIAGTPPVIHGAPTTNVRTWSQQEALRQTAESKLLVAHRRHERRMEEVGTMLLELAQQFMGEGQMMEIWGDAQQFEFVEFRGIDVPNKVDVHVQMGSSLQRSKADQRSLVMQLVDRGYFLQPQEVQDRIARLISFDDMEGLLDPDIARQQVDMRHELRLLEQGVPLNATPTQDHVAWLQMLGEYRARFAFRQLQITNFPAAYNIVIRYMQHLMFIQPVLPTGGPQPTQQGVIQ
jgi:hypothetical protein